MSTVDCRSDKTGGKSLRRKPLLRATAVAAAVACVIGTTPATAQNLNKIIHFDIAPQTLDGALLEFAHQAHVQIMFSTKMVGNRRVQALTGYFTEQQALSQLLAGLQLTFAENGNMIRIVPPSGKDGAATEVSDPPDPAQDMESTPDSKKTTTGPVAVKSPSTQKESKKQFVNLQPVVVTGTHISGGPPPSAPIITITRQDIEDSGYQSIEQVMAALPENFASVGSYQGYGLIAANDSQSISDSVAVDLDGLGFDTTLILVNGHRLAPTGEAGAFTDISVIPLSAIERVDVLTGGASAVYGSDAIGGVVNYVLRSNEQGAETSMEYGSVTQGGYKDYRVSQSLGTSWQSGNIFAAYEFIKRTALNASDRPYSSDTGPFTLTPNVTQNNLYVTATQQLETRTTLEGDLSFEQRREQEGFSVGGGALRDYITQRNYSTGFQATTRVGDNWTVKSDVRYGGERDFLENVFATELSDSGLLTIKLGGTGNVFRLPSGIVRSAIGVEFERQSFSTENSGIASSQTTLNDARTVDALYMESRIPIFANRAQVNDGPAVGADVAVRYEHYSDFGTSLNPMVGIAWQPTTEVKLRGTWSSAFRAPNFYELYGSTMADLLNSPSPGGNGGSEAALVLSGSNPRLKPERSSEWTAGIDITPPSSGFLAKLTYFHINFRDRISSPNIPLLNSLDQGSAFSSFITLYPSVADLQRVVAGTGTYANITAYPSYGPARSLGDAVAIVDDELQNVGVTNASGVDIDANKKGSIGDTKIHVGAQATYLIRYENIFVPGAVPVEVLSTFQNPVNFRGRLTAGVDHGSVSGNVALNYVNRYSDPGEGVPVGVASWTTVDLQASYRIPVFVKSGGVTVALSCENCANRYPPSIRKTTYLFGFDPTNASAVGRFVSLTLRKQW